MAPRKSSTKTVLSRPGQRAQNSRKRGVRTPGQPKKRSVPDCFVVSPIGPPRSETRKHANKVYKEIIVPALAGFKAQRIDHFSPTGDINDSIIELLYDAPLCVVVLTETNPNVMYELGVRHAWQRPSILLAERGTKLPFDINSFNTIFYELSSKTQIDSAVKALRKQAKQTANGISDNANVFASKVGIIGEAYSLNCAFVEKKKAMIAFVRNLRRIKTEIEKDFEVGINGTQPFGHFEQPVVDEFRELRMTVNVLQSLAESAGNAAPRKECLAALDRIKRLQNDGTKLCKILTSGKNDMKTYKRVCDQLDRIVEKALDIGCVTEPQP